MPRYSIIIRVKNEAANLQRCLERIQAQRGFSSRDCEIIVVDNESTDETKAVAERFGAQVLSINKFSYPKAMNLGVRAARAPICIFLSAHSFIKGDRFFAACDDLFADSAVAGAWGPVSAGQRGSIWEHLFYGTCNFFAQAWRVYRPRKARLGHLGATNCAVRRALAVEHPFDERFGHGGEDYQWADWALRSGYKIVRDSRLAVYHAHGLSLRRLVAQYRRWSYTIINPGEYKL